MRESLDLFDQDEELFLPRLEDGQLSYYANALSPVVADRVLSQCVRELPWRQDSMRIAGKEILIPRLQNWFGDAGTQYSYSGIQFTPLPWTSFLLELKETVEKISQHSFNSVLANYYRNGHDSVDWHSDDELELGEQPVIASISLGVTRVFSLRHRYKKQLPQQKLALPHGSLLIMSGPTQRYWQHRIAKQTHIESERINLTFRQIKGSR